MPKKVQLANLRFGRLIVVAESGRANDGKVLWSCRCDCGGESIVRSTDLRQGKVVSCGCHQSEVTARRNASHGQSGTRTYKVWATMIQRCTNPKNKKYHRYGMRGITVCKEWMDFAKFHADMGDAPVGMSIERVKVNEGYCLTNCKWATVNEQANNKTTTVRVEVDGHEMTLAEAEKKTGVPARTIYYRLYRGNSSDRATTKGDLRTVAYKLDSNGKFIRA